MDSTIQSLSKDFRERVAADADLAALDLPALARPSVRLAAQRVPYARIGIGDSRIGGIPDVFPGFQWPRWVPSDQRDDKFGQPTVADKPLPLGFIAQIDLSTVPSVDDTLPRSGWLYFFYDRFCEPWGFDPTDRGCCRVVYADGDRSTLTRIKPPLDADPGHSEQPCLVEAWPELSLPDDLPEIKFPSTAYDAYRALRDELAQGGGNTYHRLLGHPEVVQNPMELECQLASNGIYCGDSSGYESQAAKVLKPGASDWRLLLQIDSDEDGPGWMWGDVGRIYFWIKKQDLATLRFDNVWFVFQCC